MKIDLPNRATAALFCLFVLGAPAARADSIIAPDSDLAAFAEASSGGWAVPCDYQWGAVASTADQCGSYYETGLSSITTSLGPTGILSASSVAGADFAFQEVDELVPGYFQDTYAYHLTPVDYVLFNNADCSFDCGNFFGPLTLTVTDPNQNPSLFTGLLANIYDYAPFTATVSAYDAAGNLLGSNTFASVENDQLLSLGLYNPVYLAQLGALDVSGFNIASVAISTVSDGGTDDEFELGTVEIAPVPEPGTFALFTLAAVAALKNRFPRKGQQI